MAFLNGKADRGALAFGVIVLVVIFFFSVNLLAGNLFRSARIDLTEDRLFTVTEGTLQTLALLEEPITLRYYRSTELDLLGPFYTGLASRVEDLLSEYVERAGGLLRLERYDPAPFSPEEDLAVADGLRGVTVDVDGSQVYFGLSGINSTDDRRALPFLAPERANFLEYDLTRLIYDLAQPDKPKVAVLGSLEMRGSQADGFTPWAVVDQARQFFDVSFLGGEIQSIEEDISILMLAQPQTLDEASLYAIDQFVLRGGRVLAFVDPHAEALTAPQPGMPPPDGNAVTTMAPLLESWGVTMEAEHFVGDRTYASRVQALHDGRQVIVDYLAWLGMRAEAFDRTDVIMANVEQLNLRSVGAISAAEGAETSLTPILRSSPNAMLIETEAIAFAPSPVDLINDFEADGESRIIAARIAGPAASAFAEGPPEATTDEAVKAAHRAQSEGPINVILVADADILADQNWVQRRNLLGQALLIPIAHNGDFVINALDNLSGSEGLISLRGRGLSVRPFEVLQDMEQAAEDQFRAKEQELLQRIEQANASITDLQQQEQEAGVLLTGEQQTEIDKFRQQMLDLRGELREVQHALRQDVETLESRIKLINIWAVPLAVGLIALVLALLRRARRGGRQAALG